jgi:hypothetical protein
MWLRMNMLVLAGLLNNLTTRIENGLIVVAPTDGHPILITSAASRQSINRRTHSFLPRHSKGMHHLLQEVIWAFSATVIMGPRHSEHHLNHTLLHHHHHPKHLRVTNQRKMPTLHQAQLSSVHLHRHHRPVCIMTEDNILNLHIQQIPHVSNVRISTSTEGHPRLIHLHKLQQVATFQLWTQDSAVPRTTDMLPGLQAHVLLLLFHHCAILLSMMVSLHHLVLSLL